MISTVVIGLGRIGAGNIDLAGEIPMSHLAAIIGNRNFSIIGLVDSDPVTLGRVENFFPALSCRPVQSLAHVPDVAFDVVVIATLPEGRLDLVRDVIKRSPKLIVIEKPLAQTYDEARQIVNICQQAGVQIRVNFHRRFDIRHQQWRERRPFPATAIQMRYGRGLWNYASHQIDLIEDWYGPIKEVRALGPVFNYGKNDFTVSFFCVAEHAEQIVVLGVAGLEYDQLDAEFVGADGVLIWRAGGAEISLFESQKDRFYRGYNHLMEKPTIHDEGPVSGFKELYEVISEHFNRGTRLPGCDGQQALHGISVLSAVLASAADNGRTVNIKTEYKETQQ